MCIKPIYISNPNYSRSQQVLTSEGTRFVDSSLSSKLPTICVPCGTCVECRNTYYNSILQRGIVESLSSYVYFITLTYDDNHIPSIQLPNGKVVYFSDYTHIQNLFKRLRRNNIIDREFRYLVALEYGDKKHRPHFHLLLFVARSVNDDKLYPINLEKLLFDNIRKYYAINVGTRKIPIYEPLFTYKIKRTNHGIKTNYFVKFVNSDTPDYADINVDSVTNVKTLRYLLSYVNKGSSFDDTICSYLSEISDPYLADKLNSLLRSKIRYSKGFGLGFTDSFKNTQQRTFVKISSTYSKYLNDFPFSFSELYDHNPVILSDINVFLSKLDHLFKNQTNLRSTLSKLCETDLYTYLTLLRYFPNFITYLYRRYFKLPYTCNISYYFKFLEYYKYLYPKVSVSSINDSYVLRYIRKGIEQGLQARVPYLAFPLYSSNSFMPLCKYYRERYTTDTDLSTLYSILGVRNFDEWQNLFHRYLKNSKSLYPQANKLLRESEFMPQYVKNTHKTEKNLYNYLFCK